MGQIAYYYCNNCCDYVPLKVTEKPRCNRCNTLNVDFGWFLGGTKHDGSTPQESKTAETAYSGDCIDRIFAAVERNSRR